MKPIKTMAMVLLASLALAAACEEEDDSWDLDDDVRARPTSAHNLHLAPLMKFQPITPGASRNRGRELFGLAKDLETEDTTHALFQGYSEAAGGYIESNGRTCFTCHRGLSENLGLPPGPLSRTISLKDALFTGLDADVEGHPDGFRNLDKLGLVRYRPHRFVQGPNPKDGSREVFAWRKSIRLVNTGLQYGMLHDGRLTTVHKTNLGAVFSHTQTGAKAFPDLISEQDGRDLTAFLLTAWFEPPELVHMRNPKHPLYDRLIRDPYYTVNIETAAQRAGRDVFHKYCFSCHNTPNVFSGLENVEAQANGRPPTHQSWTAPLTVTYNIGVSERNRHKLRFAHLNPHSGKLEPVILRLAREDGSIVHRKVDFDFGLAMTTLREAHIGHFKAPQLRSLSNNAPYFHDNSADTIEEVVDYFNSDFYNKSPSGRKRPIKLSPKQRADLIEFLYIL